MTFKTVADGYGAANFTWTVQDSGGTANGGTDSLTQSLSITVLPINDAPLASGAATLPAVDEDTTDPLGDTVANLFSSNFDDSIDAGRLVG